jgi:hypothetical protein
MNPSFGAPWSTSLKIVTGFCVVVCCVAAAVLETTAVRASQPALRWFTFAPLLVVIGGASFMVRGYSISDRTLVIHRLGWTTRFDLSSFTSATVDPEALKNSIRLFGNGGLFVFAGWFTSQRLGRYRLFGTDPRRAVVLKFLDRVIVVTPDDPARFVQEITRRR